MWLRTIVEARDYAEQHDTNESKCAVSLDQAIEGLGKANLDPEIVRAVQDFVKWIRQTNERVPEYG